MSTLLLHFAVNGFKSFFLSFYFPDHQMAVYLIPALEGWNAPAHLMAHGNVGLAPMVSKEMEYFVKMSMR